MAQWNVQLPKAEWYDSSSSELAAIVNEVVAQKVVAIDTETTGLVVWKDMPLFWSLAWGNRRLCMPTATLPRFADAFAQADRTWVFANAKYDMHMLRNAGIELEGRIHDTQVIHALLYEEKPHSLDAMGKQLLSFQWKDLFDDWKKGREEVGDFLMRLFHEDPRKLIEYASNDAYGTLCIYNKLMDEAERTRIHSLWPDIYPTMWALFEKVEARFTKVLWKCESRGIKIDQGYLAGKEAAVDAELDKVQREIVKEAGFLMNPNSDDDVREYFFKTKKLKPLRWTDGGKSGIRKPCCDKLFLEYAADQGHLMAELLLRNNELSTIKNTYLKGWSKRVSSRGRLHTRFNQDIARCMPAGELVLTNRGYLPVEQVIVGDLVIAHTGKPRRVTECSVHAPTPIYNVRLSNGLELRTTGHHQYRVGDGWVRADQLEHGMSVSVHSHPERWKPVQAWPFDVSSWGRVMHRKTGRLRALQPKGEWGHLKVTLARNGAQERGKDLKDFSVHRLVLEAFGYEGSGEVRHLNGISWDNTVGNLCYGTSAENKQDALKHGTMSQRLAGRTVLTEAAVEEIRSAELRGQPPSSTSKMTFEIAGEIREERKKGTSVEALAKKHNVSLQSIYYIINNKTWTSPREGTTAADLAERFGVSDGYIREIRSGAKWKDQSYIEGSFATFFNAVVISVEVEDPEVTYGLTVEEDHSHVTGGIVTHNTGRLSSSNPNLQNVKTVEKDEFGLRGAFIADEGDVLIVGDYEQLEMRLLGCATVTAERPEGERDLINIFLSGKDIHMGNAELVFGIPYDDLKAAKNLDKRVKNEEIPKDSLKHLLPGGHSAEACLKARSAIKAVGFGLNYGMKENKLARQIGTTKEEAKEIMDRYMARYPAVKDFYAAAIEETRQTGYAFTIQGRRRFLPEIASHNTYDRYQAERQAVNAQIQGTAADVVKMAMLLCDDAQLDKRYGAVMLLQVHDELVFQCPKESAVEAKAEIKEWMEHSLHDDLIVPLDVSIGIGASWAQAKLWLNNDALLPISPKSSLTG